MKFQEYISIINKDINKKHRLKPTKKKEQISFKQKLNPPMTKKEKKEMDRLDQQNPAYITMKPGDDDNIPLIYPQVTQPAGGPVSGVGPVIS